MKVFMEVTVAHFEGELTQSGVLFNIINFLAGTLQKIVTGGYKKIRIDCKMIHKADIKGLQMLYLWMQSTRSRGVEPELINMSRNLRQDMKEMGFDSYFKIICSCSRKYSAEATNNHEKMFIGHERRRGLCLSI
jgi:anti-anti-sigma regulatory factor